MRKNIFQVAQSVLLSTILFFSAGEFTSAQPVLGFSNFITSGLTSPVDIANAHDGSNRLFIVEQGGRIRIYNGTGLLPTPFLDISAIISSGGERGLLSLAFHPDYMNNRYFFVYYTNLSGAITITRYRTQAGDPNLADPTSGVVLMNIPKPFANHNGGDLNFGPDGYLYFGTGDGGGAGDPNNYSQNGLSLLGKMIRIDVNNFLTPPYYTIPPDNPFTSDPNVDDLIWLIGLRNPWRWSFDRTTGDMWIADVGQSAWEEVNYSQAGNTGGFNYGWRCYEGNTPYNTSGCLPQGSYIAPIFVYPHNSATGGYSITGGYVYRGAEFPVLQGYYICADYLSGNVWLITPDGGGGWSINMQSSLPGSIVSFGESENGTLYAVSLAGSIYKVNVTSPLPLSLLSFSGKKKNGFNELQWNIAPTHSLRRFIIEFSNSGTNWQMAGQLTAINQGNNQLYEFRHFNNEPGRLFYRLKMVDVNGEFTYSPVIVLNGNKAGSIKVFPTVLTNSTLQVLSEKELSGIRIIDSYGQLVMSRQINAQQGYITVSLPVLSRGVYLVQLQTDSGNETAKIIVK